LHAAALRLTGKSSEHPWRWTTENSGSWTRASLFTMFIDHTQRRTAVGRTPLDEWSARRRDLLLKTHNNQNRQTSMSPVRFEPTISASERPLTYSMILFFSNSSQDKLFKEKIRHCFRDEFFLLCVKFKPTAFAIRFKISRQISLRTVTHFYLLMISTADIAAWNLVDLLKSHNILLLGFGVEM
jgi:hypothetical protein